MKKSLLPVLSLLFISALNIIPQSHFESPDYFYEAERQNWIEKIAYETSAETDTSIDVKFYHLAVSVSLTRYIEGDVVCLFESKVSGLNEIHLDLTSSLNVDSIAGNAVGYSHTGDTLYIQLDRAYGSGEEASVRIYYSGVPPLFGNIKGMRFASHHNSEPVIATLSTPYLAHLWFPCKDGPGDKADSVYIDITIPDTSFNNIPLSATSNGVLEEVITAEGKKTFKWRERYPIVTYYVMIAISNYVQFQQQYSDTSGVSFPIIYNVFRQDSAASFAGVQQLPQVIALFSSLFGAYPFHEEKYGMTQLGFYVAIENQTNTIQNIFTPDWLLVSVHELSHMWFGDMITCQNWHHGWLNEGFATYSEALWVEHISGFISYKNYMTSLNYFSGGTLYLENISNPLGVFVSIIYKKGAWAAHMLRGVLGDAVFFNAMRQYTSDTRFRYNHASTEDLQEVFESVSGVDLDYFFNQWVYDEFYPVYSFSQVQDSTTNLYTFHLNQEQSNNGWREVFTMPVQLKLNFAGGGDTLLVLWNDQKNQQFQFSLSGKVTSAVLDPDGWILKKLTSPTGIASEDIYPPVYYLHDNYPNPFNASTRIKFSIGNSQHVKLEIYDITGRKISVLVNDVLSAGEHTIDWDASNFSSGIYFYRLNSGDYIKTKKLIIMK